MRSINGLTLVFILLGFPQLLAQEKETLLRDVQERIYQEFLQSFEQGEETLAETSENLKTAWERSQDRDYAYWAAYADYYLTLYYAKMQKTDEADLANQAGQKVLESISEKTSEDYVLLADLVSLTMMYDQSQAIVTSKKANKYAQKALKLDKQNPRVYLHLGSSDFYKPEEYGGGKVVEENLLKALSLKDQHLDSPYAPTWGRNDAYATLVQYYLREGEQEQAKIYCARGLKLFPDDYMLLQCQQKIDQ